MKVKLSEVESWKKKKRMKGGGKTRGVLKDAHVLGPSGEQSTWCHQCWSVEVRRSKMERGRRENSEGHFHVSRD